MVHIYTYYALGTLTLFINLCVQCEAQPVSDETTNIIEPHFDQTKSYITLCNVNKWIKHFKGFEHIDMLGI